MLPCIADGFPKWDFEKLGPHGYSLFGVKVAAQHAIGLRDVLRLLGHAFLHCGSALAGHVPLALNATPSLGP
jgi:hypothetical protein